MKQNLKDYIKVSEFMEYRNNIVEEVYSFQSYLTSEVDGLKRMWEGDLSPEVRTINEGKLEAYTRALQNHGSTSSRIMCAIV